MSVLLFTKIGREHRTTIPREVCKLLKLGVNDEAERVFENSRVYVRKKGGLSG